MEQPCYQCGQSVEEGVPFCPHCSAPQIRVVVPEPAASAAATGVAGPSNGSIAVAVSSAASGTTIPARWSDTAKPCALAAAVAFLLMLARLNTLVAILGAGFLAVVFYRQRRPGIAIKSSTGARLGAISGLLCFALVASLTVLVVMVPELRAKLQEQIVQEGQNFVLSHPNYSWLQAGLDQLKTTDGFLESLAGGGVVLFVLSMAFGSLGGILAATIFARGRKP